MKDSGMPVLICTGLLAVMVQLSTGLQCYVCDSDLGDTGCSFSNGPVSTFVWECKVGVNWCTTEYRDTNQVKRVVRQCSDSCINLRRKRDYDPDYDYDCCERDRCNAEMYDAITPPDGGDERLQCYVCDSEQGDSDCFFSNGPVSAHLQDCQTGQDYCVAKYIKDWSGDEQMERFCSNDCIDGKKRDIDPDYDYDCCETDGCNDERYGDDTSPPDTNGLQCYVCDSEQGDSDCFFSGGAVSTHLQDCLTGQYWCIAEYKKIDGFEKVKRTCSSDCVDDIFRRKRDIDPDYDYDCCDEDGCNDERYDDLPLPSEGLWCFSCDTRQGDTDCTDPYSLRRSHAKVCNAGENYCIKVVEEINEEQIVKRKCSDSCLDDALRKKRDLDDDYDYDVDCCDYNGCNAASSLAVSVTCVITCLILIMSFLKYW